MQALLVGAAVVVSSGCVAADQVNDGAATEDVCGTDSQAAGCGTTGEPPGDDLGASEAGSDTSEGSGGTDPDGTDSGPAADQCSEILASDLTLRDVDIFQTVGIAALSDGVAVAPRTRVAPLVAERAAVVRVAFDVGAGFSAQDLGARVEITSGGTSESFVDAMLVQQSTGADGIEGSFVVQVPAAAMQIGATYSVSVVECGDASGQMPSPDARFPTTGDADLAAVQTGVIKLHLVPFEVGGFVPDTSAAVLDGFRDAILSVYPATAVQVTVGDVVPDDNGGVVDMGNLLVGLGVIQEQVDAAPADVYYYGLVTGAASREEFCSSCPTGTSESGSGTRAAFALGAAFADDKSQDTLIHEMGHMHGLLHAPCGDPELLDERFPYRDAAITSEGYDFRTGTFIPVDHKDMMAYCFPRWVSDYNYRKLVAWVQLAQSWSGGTDGAPADTASSTVRCFDHR